MKDFLNEQMVLTSKTIVDVGGNEGEFIPELTGLQNRFVLEISKKELPRTIKRIESLDEVGIVDLVMYAHVLEHVSNPYSNFRNL